MFYYENVGETTAHGQTIYRVPGPWGGAVAKVTGAMCDDGRHRTATTTAYADTFFSQPARVHVAGRTVTGFLSYDEDGLARFTANRFGRNYRFLPTRSDRFARRRTLYAALCAYTPYHHPEAKRLRDLIWRRCESMRAVWVHPWPDEGEMGPVEAWKPAIEAKWGP